MKKKLKDEKGIIKMIVKLNNTRVVAEISVRDDQLDGNSKQIIEKIDYMFDKVRNKFVVLIVNPQIRRIK